MMRLQTLLTGMLVAGLSLASVLAAAQDCVPDLGLPAVTHAAAIAAALQAQAAVPPELIHPDGCFVWHQPGVALTVTGVWLPGAAAGLYYDPGRCQELLLTLPALQQGNPFIHPPEPEDGDEARIPAQAWLLDATESQDRLAQYMEGYTYWMELNTEGEFIVPDEAALQTDAALVYISPGGPLEFHFQLDTAGQLHLRHILCWDYFSA